MLGSEPQDPPAHVRRCWSIPQWGWYLPHPLCQGLIPMGIPGSCPCQWQGDATPSPLGNLREMCSWKQAGGNNIPKPRLSPAFPAARRRERPIFPLTMPFYQGVCFYYSTG